MIRTSASSSSGPVLLFGAAERTAALGGALKDALKAGAATQFAGPSGPANGVRVGPGVGRAKGETFQLGSASVTVTDTREGRIVTGPLVSEDGRWLTQISPGTEDAITRALRSLV